MKAAKLWRLNGNGGAVGVMLTSRRERITAKPANAASSRWIIIVSGQYLGPNVFQLSHVFILVVTNSLVLFALILLLGRTVWSMSLNMTTIESWEIERHETLLRRARTLGGHLDGPEGKKIRIERQEFPWDVGIWRNLCAMMGSRNPLVWFWPFARSLTLESGLQFEHNGIEDPSKPWPPPDPDRMFRVPRQHISGNGFTQSMDVAQFRKRQEADLARHADADGEYVVRRKPFHERLEDMQRHRPTAHREDDVAVETDSEASDSEEEELPVRENIVDDAGEEGWRNKEGERLGDFGVDEVADFYDEDDMPLADIIRKRQAEH
ncbi:Palmitoyltransferase [Saxophila tyrrhenica]|uniref:Palmitoyltransferase n=1 Tax=Saxophila tyrrhenica TaxID=1690608 RepID=A0AAV9PGS4_9PEZI|nr:Palmitoyltransferase [Saxophila tyrrhenica]